jgi:hypothetical protein
MSALAAAAKVLVWANEPMATKQTIEAMALKHYWASTAVQPRRRRFIPHCHPLVEGLPHRISDAD